MKMKTVHRYLCGISIVMLFSMAVSMGAALAEETEKDDDKQTLKECCTGAVCLTACLIVFAGGAGDVTYMPSVQFLGKSPEYVDQYLEAYQTILPNVETKSSFLRRVIRTVRSIPALIVDLVSSGV